MAETGDIALAREVVALMAELVSESGPAFEAQHGEEGLTVTLEIQAALLNQLEGNLGHVVLWEQFLRTPQAVMPAVINVVQSLMDCDPILDDWLQEQMARYHGT